MENVLSKQQMAVLQFLALGLVATHELLFMKTNSEGIVEINQIEQMPLFKIYPNPFKQTGQTHTFLLEQQMR